MNIFILDNNIKKSVQYYCDKHIVKMLTETCQMLSTVYRLNNESKIIPEFIYKITHKNHPCTLWLRKCGENWQYGIKLGQNLYREYQYRYNKPEKHQKAKQILDYLSKKEINLPINVKITPFAQAMPEKYRSKNAIKSYRNYYIGEKQHIFTWTKRNKPIWIK